MGVLLLVIVVLVSLALAARAWRGYEAAFRRGPGDGEGAVSVGPIPGEPFVDCNSSSDTSHTHHGGTACGAFHHNGCDVGHGGFDGGGHH